MVIALIVGAVVALHRTTADRRHRKASQSALMFFSAPRFTGPCRHAELVLLTMSSSSAALPLAQEHGLGRVCLDWWLHWP